MPVKNIDKFDIEDDIIEYFARRFRRPVKELNRNTDLKQYFGYAADDWAAMADLLSKKDWALGVGIPQSAMSSNTTAAKLAQLIWNRFTKSMHDFAHPAGIQAVSLTLSKRK